MKIFFFLTILLFFSCQKLDLPKDTPKCVKKKIKLESDKGLNEVYKNVYEKAGITGSHYVTYYKLVYISSNDSIGSFISEDCLEFECYIKEPINPPQGATNCYDNIESSELIWTKN
jgi:hypothetical protein